MRRGPRYREDYAFHFSAIETAMADHLAIVQEYRHFVAEPAAQILVGVDIYPYDACSIRAEEFAELLEHDFAEMTVCAADQSESWRRMR